MNSKSRCQCAAGDQAPDDEDQVASSAIAKIVAREVEPLRDELARLRANVAALRDYFVPW